MKCAQCGLPLSPSRANCPRCGAPAGKASGKIRLTRDISPVPPHVNLPADINTLNETPPVWPTLAAPAPPPSEPITEQQPFPVAEGGFFPSTAAFVLPQQDDAVQAQNQPSIPITPTPSAPSVPSTPSEPYYTPSPWAKPTFPPDGAALRRQPKTRLGITIAAMCFTAGIIIMIFVFIMAQSLSPDNLKSSTSTTSKPKITSVQTPTPVLSTPTSIQATPTLTSTATANQYISNVNLASSVDTSTGQPLQTATEFHASQSIYVTMTIQQAAYNGAVCLDWSVNNQAYPYANSATPSGATYLTQTNAYFYYKPGTVGSGNVQVSWASSTACTDKVLIQTLNFTVIA